MRLETQRLDIHDLALEDAPAMAKYRAKEEVARYQSYKNYNLTKATKRIQECLDNPFEFKPGSYQLGIYLKGTDTLLGDIYINIAFNNEISLGYTLDSEYWRKGYMYESMRTFLRFLHEEYQVKVVYCMVKLANTASLNLLNKLGFEEYYRSHFRKVACYIGRL